MGYLWGLFDRPERQNQRVGYFPCAPGCRASESDPRRCQCICRGVNHGILIYGRPERPIVVPSGPVSMFSEESFTVPQIAPQQALPNLTPSPRVEPLPRTQKERMIFPVARGTKKFLKKITGIVSQNELNENVLKGLRNQFNADKVDSIVDQAFSVFYSRIPDANRPELYELYENGDIDRALDFFKVRWVIGRPKIRKN